jgi:histidinol-phosphate aminotransferase
MTAFDPARLALPHVAGLHAYVPGLQPDEPGWIKLNTNESPYPPGKYTADALRREIGEEGAVLRLYPSPSARALREALGRLHGVGAEQICVGNGSDDILNLLVRCFCGPERPAGFTVPSYSLYPVLVGIQGGAARIVEFDRSFTLPVDRIAGCGANVFFLTSPNAPSGVGFSTAALDELAARFPGLLVVDEAYADFAAENAAGLVANHPNVCVVRSFSKGYGLAGVRLGYAVARPEVVALLDRVRDSYNVDRLAQVAGLAALEDRGAFVTRQQAVVATRERAAEGMRARGWFVYPSQANFLLVEPRTAAGEAGPEVAAALDEHLRRKRILVRRFPSHPLTAAFLRITVGTEAEMAALAHAFDTWPAHVPPPSADRPARPTLS